MKNDHRLTTSALGRLFKIGNLAGHVGFSMAGNATANLFRSNVSRTEHHLATLMANARRIKETLGDLKGLPMKIGQMLSLHEGLLPPEVARILATLQQKAPPIAFGMIQAELGRELGGRADLIATLEPEAFAAASIGQVHRAVLKDGRRVAFKVQYPGIDQVIAADMKNLKGVLGMLFGMLTQMDMTLIWEELHARLLEELDYEHEAANLSAMRAACAGDHRIVIPEVVPELSSRHILCTTFLEGIPPEQVTAGRHPQALRDTWGQVLFTLLCQSIFLTGWLHADPNLANFAFLEDGRVIVYDFGCVKRIPPALTLGYARLARAVLDQRDDLIPELLRQMGVHRSDGTQVSQKIVTSMAEIIREPLGPDPHAFGQNGDFYARLRAHIQSHWAEAMEIVFPQDIIFIDRTVGGHIGNLIKLKAKGHWRRILEPDVIKSLNKR